MTSRPRLYLLLCLLFVLTALAVYRFRIVNAPTMGDSSTGATTPVDGEPLPDIAARAHAPQAMQESKWLRERTQRFRSLFRNWQCDELVLPVQVEASAFDHATRNLMAGDIALAMKGSSRCVADPALVELALGESMRRYSDRDVLALARDLQAKTVVLTWAGHDAKGHMRVTLQVAHPDAKDVRISPTSKKSFTDLAYTDSVSPFDAFHEHVVKMLAGVGIHASLRPKQTAGTLGGKLPSSPREILDLDGVSTVERAARLTLLGMLAPRNDSTAQDRLFTNALLTLADLEDTPLVKVLRGHILLNMRERPYGLRAIEGLQSAEAEGLRAAMNGNLPAVRANLLKVTEPWERLFLSIETYDIELDYERDGSDTAPIFETALGSDWAALLNERRGDDDQWIIHKPIAIKQTLDSTFPLPGPSLQDIAQGSFVLRQVGDEADFDQLAVKHARALLESHGHDFCCGTYALGPTRWDVLDFLDNRAERALLRKVYYYIAPQDLNQTALDLLARYDDVLAGNPYAEDIRALATWYLLGNKTTNRQESMGLIHKAARIAAVTAPGQTQPVVAILWALFQPPAEPFAHALVDAYCDDYPMRHYWKGNPDTLKARLLFSSSDIAPLDELFKNAKGIERKQLLAELDNRFDGNSRATVLRLEAKMGQNAVDPDVLRQAIDADPDNWEVYEWLGNYYMSRGSFAKASDLIVSFPGFKKTTHRTVELSIHAYKFGNRLYWLGEEERARPLLKIAADYDNGSTSSLLARAELALLDSNYTSAAMLFLEEGRHYNDSSAYSDFFDLLFAGGESKVAWNGFDQLVGRLRGPRIWESALIGHRREGLSQTQLREWIANKASNRQISADDQPLARYALMEQLIDRGDVLPDFAQYILTLAGPANVRVSADGRSFLGKLDSDQEHRVGPSEFGQTKRRPVAANATVPNRYALFAKAYVALRSKQFEEASIDFDDLAAYYDIETTEGWGFALPYFAYAAAQSGDKFGLEKYLTAKQDANLSWGMLLARAIFAGAHGRIDESDKLLEKAHLDRPASGNWPVITAFEYAQTCVWLYDLTKDDRYRVRALNRARSYTKIAPTQAWAHALTALLSTNPDEQVRELAYALYLDPQSAWVAQTPNALRTKATDWLEKHELFRLREPGTTT